MHSPVFVNAYWSTIMEKNVTTLKVPARRIQVNYKGLHGWLTYDTNDKRWHWTFKAQFVVQNNGDEPTREKAELAMKRFMDAAAVSKSIRSVD